MDRALRQQSQLVDETSEHRQHMQLVTVYTLIGTYVMLQDQQENTTIELDDMGIVLCSDVRIDHILRTNGDHISGKWYCTPFVHKCTLTPTDTITTGDAVNPA